MGTRWKNVSMEICEKNLGSVEFEKRLRKSMQISDSILTTKSLFGSGSQTAKKMVGNAGRNILRRSHAVGAVGYAVVKGDKIPPNDFFVDGRRFRLRFRHSNVNCDDDAASCQREAAIKFADRNEDGPLDLILFTGRTAPARNVKGLNKVLKLTTKDKVRAHCLEDPDYYFSLVDGLRRAPTSFADLTYHSQMPYQFVPTDGIKRAVRFRLVPGCGPEDGAEQPSKESGLLDDRDQRDPWETSRRPDETRSPLYLRDELVERLKLDEPVRYVLQMQIAAATDYGVWDPQRVLDEEVYPWRDVLTIELTTLIPLKALRQTFFNIVEKPKCLTFPEPKSANDPLTYQKLWKKIYTEFELKHIQSIVDDTATSPGGTNYYEKGLFVKYLVTVRTKSLKEGRPPAVDMRITFTGTLSRSTPQPLVRSLDLSPRDGMERFEVQAEDVGELLLVVVSVKYRQLADDWYLHSVTVTDPHVAGRLHRFPCHNVVLSKVTLRTGQAFLPHQELYEDHRQERMLDLCENQIEYAWMTNGIYPSQIKGRTVDDLPPFDKQRASKFKGMLWQIDQEAIDFFRNLRQSMSTTGRIREISSTISQRPLGASFTSRQMSLQEGSRAYDARMRTAMIRMVSIDVHPVYNEDSGRSVAVSRWKKAIKRTVRLISEAKIPEGSKGEMCREVQNDVEFGRIFVGGINPMLIRRCRSIPDNFPVTHDSVASFLDRKKTLEGEIEDGRVYLVDYRLLNGIRTFDRNADHRYLVAPLVLLYVRSSGDLIPLAIQLHQNPGPTNPIWTPKDRPENWTLAKLWVRCADFHYGFAVSHFFRCHILMEPFAVATMRQLSSAHPVYKLLKPHIKYTVVTNTLIRNNVTKKGCLLDRYTSLGTDGFQELLMKYWSQFTFEDLDPIEDFRRREVDDDRKLPNYFYRDDAVRLWNVLSKYCRDVLQVYYKSPEDVATDEEIGAWLLELNSTGFPNLSEAQRRGLPKKFDDLEEVANLVTKVIFTLTCQHSATHSDAMDFCGFIPDVPAMMRMPPPASRLYEVTRDTLTMTLPDQYTDAYYGTLAYVMQIHKPDENTLQECDEIYFSDPEALAVTEEFRKSLSQITTTQRARNIIAGYQYESLMPIYIPTSAEPLPYVPRDTLKASLKGLGLRTCRDIFFGGIDASIPVMSLPICRQFARTMGGRSTVSRRLTMTIVKGLRDAKDSSAAAAAAADDDMPPPAYSGGAAAGGSTGRQAARTARLTSSHF